MTDDKKCCGSKSNSEEKSSSCCGGDKKKSCCKSIMLLVILIAVAVGVFVYAKNKKPEIKPEDTKKVVEVEAPKNENPVLVLINDKEIKRQEVIDIVNSMPPQMKQIPMEQLFPMALEQLVNNVIIDNNASSSGLENDEDIITQLEQVKTQLIRAKFLENTISEKITEERLQQKYAVYLESFPDVEEIKAAHILVDDEKLAKSIIKKLNSGADFADLAKENSKDGSSENGGELGYFSKADVVAPFAEAAFATKVGGYTKAPVKSDFGYHIIKVEEKRKRQPAEFAQIKPYLEQEMQRVVHDEVLAIWKAEVEIKRFDINGKPIAEEAAPEEASPAAGEKIPVVEEVPVVEEAPKAE